MCCFRIFRSAKPLLDVVFRSLFAMYGHTIRVFALFRMPGKAMVGMFPANRIVGLHGQWFVACPRLAVIGHALQPGDFR